MVDVTNPRTPIATRAADPERADFRLRRVLETEAVGVLFFEASSGTLLDANDAFLRMTGYKRAEVESRQLTWRTMTPPEWVKVSEEQMESLASTGRIGPYEKQYFCKDGSRRWMLFAGRDLGDGTISEFCIDITQQKRTEAAFRNTETQLKADLAGMRRLYDLYAKLATETDLKIALDSTRFLSSI